MSTSTTSTTSSPGTTGTAAGIDPRGPQFVAGVTAVTIAAALLAPAEVGLVIAAVQTALFALGAARGVQHTPSSWLFRTLVRPRLGPPDHLEAPAPPRFAQAVGFVFLATAVIAFIVGQSATGVTLLAQVALGLALVAALLNAVFAFCLGCEIYLLLKRLTHNPA